MELGISIIPFTLNQSNKPNIDKQTNIRYNEDSMITKKDLLKERFNVLLYMALDKNVDLYKTSTGDVNWNAFRDDILQIIDNVFDSGLLK